MKSFIKAYMCALTMLVMVGCSADNNSKDNSTPMKTQKEKIDAHSFSEPETAKVTHLNWQANVNFDTKTISATATWNIETAADAEELILDIRDLEIIKVSLDGDTETSFTITEAQPFLGQALIIAIEHSTNSVSVEYKTSPSAAALQWLSPNQTAEKKNPFLFTQSQAILARTWMPCQDSPGIRFTYDAQVTVPSHLLAIMSATNPKELNSDGIYSFKMAQPIPSYLLAMSVGGFEYAQLGKRTGIYAESSMIEKSKYEFADMENMVLAAEKLYGPYDWEQFDMIILPPSFPFGGMENPRITFATPTIIAGDRSLTALVAHELAHSWSGNLVTNSNWNDFWLNEGFTVYFERRIMESLYGKPYAEMLTQLGYQDLLGTLDDFKDTPNDTKLKLDLSGRDPDDGMSDIAYEKGYFLLRLLEQSVGRENWDKFLLDYFTANKFKSMTTEKFVDILNGAFKGNEDFAAVNVQQWIYEPGLPDNCPAPNSDKFSLVENELSSFMDNGNAKSLKTSEWSSHEWLHFIRNIPSDISDNNMAELDKAFGFTKSGNCEILAAWFIHTIDHNYTIADQVVDSFLVNVGRRKFLTPTYKALIKADTTKSTAIEIYKKARSNYHAVAIETLDKLLDYQG